MQGQPPGPWSSASLQYRAGLRKKTAVLVCLMLLLGGLSIAALMVGSYKVPLTRILGCLAGTVGGSEAIVVLGVRLPRIVAALLSGWALGMAGVAVQSLLKNPLASPFTLGISHGAAFGAAVAIVIGGSAGWPWSAVRAGAAEAVVSQDLWSISVFALAGAMLTTAVILVLAVFKRMAPEAIILAGVALSSLFLSGTILIQYFATEEEIAAVVFWTFGDVARSTWPELFLLAVVSVGITLFFIWSGWNMNALAAGEDVARGLGVRVDALRLSGMFLASVAAAIVTALHGVIAFLGLLAPHISRRLVGADHRFLVPCSCMTGALLLLGADTIGRCLGQGGGLPVGVLTSFMGAPLFLYLLIRGRTT